MQEKCPYEESTHSGNEYRHTMHNKMQGKISSQHQLNMLSDAQTTKDAFYARSSKLNTLSMHMLHASCSPFLSKLTVPMLVDAANKCSRGVRWKASVSTWMFNVWLNCAKLHKQILNGTYKLSKYVVFMIYDKKPRKIHSTKFADRVVQRAICDNGLLDDICKPLIYENGACLEGKGFTFAFELVEKHLRQFYFKDRYLSNVGWFVKLDVKKFFDSTPHFVLKKVVKKTIKDWWIRQQVDQIIDSFNDPRSNTEIQSDQFGSRGVVLGSQISQLLQLLVLNDLDHKVKQKFKVKYYVRYMDDMLMLVKTKEEAQQLISEVEEELSKVGLQLNKKSYIGRIQDGFKFLNVHFRLSSTGKISKKLGKKTIQRELHRLKVLVAKLKAKEIDAKTFTQHLNSWFGSNQCKMSKGQIRLLKSSIKNYLMKMSKEETIK